MYKKIIIALLAIGAIVPFTGSLTAAAQQIQDTSELAWWHGGWRGGYGWGGGYRWGGYPYYGGGYRWGGYSPYYGGGYYGGYNPYYYRPYYNPYMYGRGYWT